MIEQDLHSSELSCQPEGEAVEMRGGIRGTIGWNVERVHA